MLASHDTVAEIRAVEQPLPTTVLLRLETPNILESGGRIVCGLGGEVKIRSGFANGGLDIKTDVCRVEKVIIIILIIVVLYAAGESIGTRYQLLLIPLASAHYHGYREKYFDKG